MTLHELVQRDLRKAQLSLVRARQKPNVTEEEIENLERLTELRVEICELVRREY